MTPGPTRARAGGADGNGSGRSRATARKLAGRVPHPFSPESVAGRRRAGRGPSRVDGRDHRAASTLLESLLKSPPKPRRADRGRPFPRRPPRRPGMSWPWPTGPSGVLPRPSDPRRPGRAEGRTGRRRRPVPPRPGPCRGRPIRPSHRAAGTISRRLSAWRRRRVRPGSTWPSPSSAPGRPRRPGRPWPPWPSDIPAARRPRGPAQAGRGRAGLAHHPDQAAEQFRLVSPPPLWGALSPPHRPSNHHLPRGEGSDGPSNPGTTRAGTGGLTDSASRPRPPRHSARSSSWPPATRHRAEIAPGLGPLPRIGRQSG